VGKWIEIMESWIGGGPGGEKRVKTFRWLLIAGLVGVTMLILNSFMQVKQVKPMPSEQTASVKTESEAFLNRSDHGSPFIEYEKAYEDKIKTILEQIAGVSGVEVMVSIDSTEEIVVHEDRTDTEQITEESDRNGTKRHITNVSKNGKIILYEAAGGQAPVIVKTIKPKVRGVVVVAGGVENPVVHKLITEAVRTGLDVNANRISVVPRKQKG